MSSDTVKSGAGRSNETEFNRGLGDAMRTLCTSQGVTFHSEEHGLLFDDKTKRGKTADVLVLGPDQSALTVECEYDSDPMKDAEARLGLNVTEDRGVINTAIGVYAPSGGRKIFGQSAHESNLIKNRATIRYAVITRNKCHNKTRWPTKGYITGTAASLTELAVHHLISHEQVHDQAEDAAQTMVGISRELAVSLKGNNAALRSIAKAMGRPSGTDSLNVVGVVWLNAFLFQDRIAEHRDDVPYRSSLQNSSGNPIPSNVRKAWEAITAIDYESVYSPALEALNLIDAEIGTKKTASLLGMASKLAEKIQSSSFGIFDIGGELFPRLISDRAESASYYTRPEVAEFLAHLAAFEDWSPPSKIPYTVPEHYEKQPELRIGDFSCGTGALLRAGYRRIRSKALQSNVPIQSVNDLHKHMMEDGIAGFDISPIAAHLTASSLSNIQPNVDYDHTNIGVVGVCQPVTEQRKPRGKSKPRHVKLKDAATTGSLEFLAKSQLGDMFAQGGAAVAGGRKNNFLTLHAKNNSFDLVLMNPPYSRTRGGQAIFDIAGASEDGRKGAQKRTSVLLKNTSANLQAGLAAAFCELARLKLKPGGRLGIVLPMTAASAASWSNTRRMLEDEFDDLTLIAYACGSAGGDDAISEDTIMGEMLVVGTKRKNKRSMNDPRPDVVTVTIAQSFTSVPEAVETARAVSSQEFHSNSQTESGVIYVGDDQAAEWTRTTSADGVWTAVGAVSFDLVALADNLTRHGKFNPLDKSHVSSQIPMTTIGNLFEVGPTHHLIGHREGKTPIGAFKFHVLTADSKRIKDLSLWAASSSTQTKINVRPTHYGTRAGTAEQANEMRSKSSTLFYQRNMRWTSQKILATVTSRPHMGGRAWASLIHNDEAVRFGFAIWANSSLGMLVHWNRGQRQQLGRSLVQIEGIQKMPCPDFEDATLHSASRALLDKQPELLDLVLKPANEGDQDQARSQINAAAAKLLGIEEDALADIARVWCAEPTVRAKSTVRG